MIILHGAFLEEKLFLWAEAPAEARRKPGNDTSAAARSRGPRAHPLDAGFDAVARALRGMPVGFRPTRRRKATAVAWLPSRGDQPLPSSALIGEEPNSRAKLKLAPWSLEGLFLEPAESLELLSSWRDRSAVHGVLVGRDLAYWADALRVAGSLVARQRFLPGLVEREGGTYARWQPVWIGDDADALRSMAARMPAVARALVPEPTRAAPDTAASAVLADFIEMHVDEIIRSHTDELPGASVPRSAPSTNGSVHDRWLEALRTRSSRVEGAPEEIAQLREQIREWRRPVDTTATAAFRLCFRLEEPPPSKEDPRARRGRKNGRGRRRDAPRPGQRRWYVRYLLQARDDPTLTVPTADAWITRGRKAAAISRMGEDVHMELIAALGQAAHICPRIEESLRSRKPSGYSLDAKGAHEFLTATAPALEQAGFGVILPDWWTGTASEHHLGVRARVRTPPLEEAEDPQLDDVLNFDWEIALGGRPLSGRDLEDLARLKEPLVKVRGHWLETGVEEIHAALEFYKNRGGGAMTGRDIVQLALGTSDASAGIRFEGVHATGWLGDLLERLEDKTKLEPASLPQYFVGELRPYQQRGLDWLAYLRRWTLGACLADDMGLGKTIQTLALVQREREAGEDRPVLLVCPTSVIANWEHEAARFTPKLPVAIHHGPGRAHGWEFTSQAQDQGLVVTSYALLHRDLEDLALQQWAGIVLDEAQNIKNPETKQSQAVRALRADYKVALTGTPVENHVGDLWSIMDFLNPGLLGSEEQFKRGFFVPIQAYRDREASEQLQRLTGPFILRRLKTDRSIISDLPEKLEMKVYCTLTGEQGMLYRTVVEDAERKIRDAEGIERRGVILATLSKLKQVCNHPAHYLGDGSEATGRSGKLTRLTEMLEEVIEAGDRSLVFTQFVEMGKILQSHLQDSLGREVLFLHGGVQKRRRDSLVERFQSGDDDAPIFVLSLKAGGTGLNLTGASHVFHFDRWWNPAVENQATDRAFRIGQRRNVQVHKYVCAGTLEEKIDQMIERKKSIAENIVGAGEAWITELSDEELHDVFALDADAVRD